MHIAVNTKTTSFCVTVHLPHPTKTDAHHRKAITPAIITLYGLKKTTLFSLAIKAMERLSTKKKKDGEKLEAERRKGQNRKGGRKKAMNGRKRRQKNQPE